ncbi:MAG: LysR family transcriptional regulator substrate-binding protein, partial [Acidimicrobiales bacterium]|nr:LysR family transcriptional regulator substrate-binding protein [Acidimicrobiales bacterium]
TPPGVDVTPVLEDPLAVLAPMSSTVTSPAQWGPWVTFPSGSHTRRLVAHALRSTGATFDVVAESHQPEVLREMVLLDLGWTVLPLAGLGPLDGLRVVEAGLTSRSIVLARRTGAPPDPTRDALERTLRGSREPE